MHILSQNRGFKKNYHAKKNYSKIPKPIDEKSRFCELTMITKSIQS
jgi:hypothetical protein